MPTTANQRTVLVIDDDPQVQGLLRQFIEMNGCRALVAAGTEGGLALARGQQVDVVLLDIVLPDENGMVALQRIRACLPAVPVIMITGFDDLARARACLAAGARDYLTKPFDFEYLRTSMLANMLGV